MRYELRIAGIVKEIGGKGVGAYVEFPMEAVYQLKAPVPIEEIENLGSVIAINGPEQVEAIQLVYASYDGLLMLVLNPESDSFIEVDLGFDPHEDPTRANEEIVNIYDRIVAEF